MAVRSIRDSELERRLKERIMRNIVLRIRKRKAAVALQSWTFSVAEAKRHRQLLTRAACKMRHRKLAAAWASARDFVLRRVFARCFLSKMVNRWVNKELANGFDAWRYFLVLFDRDIHEREAAKLEEARKERLMRNIVLRIKHRQIDLAMSAWLMYVYELKRRRRLLLRAAAKLRYRKQAASWESPVKVFVREMVDCSFVLSSKVHTKIVTPG